MTSMPPGLRKLALTGHVTASVGWLGAVAAFLALAIAGLSSNDPLTVRGAYVAMSVSTWYAIVPLCLATLATGILSSLGTPWGLFRHYWVLAKLLITVLSTLLLFLHTQPIDLLAEAAADGPLAADALRPQRVQLVVVSALAIAALLVTTTLSVYKPRGMTRYGWRKLREERIAGEAQAPPS